MENKTAIEEALRYTALFMLHGGYLKAIKLFNVLKSPDFTKLPTDQQGVLVLDAMGPVVLKVLQVAGAIPNLFPAHIQSSINRIYDQLPPTNFKDIETLVCQQLQIQSLKEKFTDFEPAPVKVGSIAQLHRAQLHDGRVVAVKIVKPEVLRSLQQDMTMVEPLIQLAHQFYPHIHPENLYQVLKENILNECNMRAEAQRLTKLGESLKTLKDVVVPKVIETHSSDYVLTMDFMEGNNLFSFPGNKKLAERYLNLLFKQMFDIGIIQADPNQANYLYEPTHHQLACVDAGLLCYLDNETQTDVARFLLALATSNSDLLASVIIPAESQHAQMAVFHQFKQHLRKEIASIKEHGLAFKGEEILAMMNRIYQSAEQHNLPFKPLNPLLIKAIFTGITTAKTIAPQLDPFSLLAKHVAKRLGKKDTLFLLKHGWKITKTV